MIELYFTCRICGCTDDRACPGGCWWVEDDLCSTCDEQLSLEEAARRLAVASGQATPA